MHSKNETDKNLISCIIPTYKRSDTLLRAVNSILNQTHKIIEVLVVDDNIPNDKYSIEVQKKLNSIKDDRLHYIQQEKHINGAAARNYGVKLSRGPYVAFLDDDDEWLPNKLELQLKELVSLDSSFGAVSCLTSIYKGNKKVRTTPPYSGDNLHRKVLEHSVSVFTGTVLFRKEHLDKSGYFNESLQRHQDLQLFTDFLAQSKMKPMNVPLMISHVDDDNNRPNTKKLIDVKERFFEVMTDDLNMYTKKEQKDIRASHYFEVIFSALKEKKVDYVLKYVLKIGFNLSAYKNVLQRYKERKI